MKGVFLRNFRLDLCFSFSRQSSRQNKMLLRSKKTVSIWGKMAKKVKGVQGQRLPKICQSRCPQKCVEGQHYQKTCQRMRMFRVRTWFLGVELPGELPTSDVDQLVRPFLTEERDGPKGDWRGGMDWPACHWLCRRWNGSDPLVVEAHHRSPEIMRTHQNNLEILNSKFSIWNSKSRI